MTAIQSPYSMASSTYYQQLGAAHSTKLQPWFAALANRNYAQVNVACLGTSITEGYGATAWGRDWPSMLGAALNSRFPAKGLTTHGRGWLGPILPGTPIASGISATAYCTVTGTPGTGVVGYGLNLQTYDISAGGGCTLTYSLVGTTAFIFWIGLSGGGTFSWKVDSGGTTNVSTNQGSLGSAGAHTLTIAWVSGGGTFIDGVVECNGDENSGILCHNGGFTGTTSGQWATDLGLNGSVIHAAAIAEVEPDLVILELGTNDPGSSITASQFGANVQTLISVLRTSITTLGAHPLPAFLLLGSYNNFPTNPAQWTPYVNQMYSVAAGDDMIDVFDLTLRWPYALASDTFGLYYTDNTHPSNQGHSALADNLCAFLTPA